MAFANIISRRSYDPRTKVGCIIVAEDNTQCIAVGYNGRGKGVVNEPKSLEPGCSGMTHAEINCLIKSPQESVSAPHAVLIKDSHRCALPTSHEPPHWDR
jgi:deoxycytidylate deaminase